MFSLSLVYAGRVSKELFGIKKRKTIKPLCKLALEDFQKSQPTHFENGLLLYITIIV
jgi:hypothetical protein